MSCHIDSKEKRENRLNLLIDMIKIESQAHKADEYLWLEDYWSAVDFYRNFALRQVGRNTKR